MGQARKKRIEEIYAELMQLKDEAYQDELRHKAAMMEARDECRRIDMLVQPQARPAPTLVEPEGIREVRKVLGGPKA